MSVKNYVYGGMPKNQYQEIVNYLKNEAYPERIENLKKDKGKAVWNWKRSCSRYELKGDLLWFKLKLQSNEYETKNLDQNLRQVLMEGEVEDAIAKVHHDICHLGQNQTQRAIVQRFYWQQIKNDVAFFVKNCYTCQLNQPFKEKPAVLRPVPPPRTAFSMWSMDLTTIKKTNEGYIHILVIVDYLTKWVEAFPLKCKEAKEVLKCFENEICYRYGFPKVLITDNGTEFCNKQLDEFCKQNNITHRVTSPYHPQSNGLVEVTNKAVKQGLRKLMVIKKELASKLKDNENWTEDLGKVLFSLRTRKRKATKFSAFELVFGRNPRLAIDNEISQKAKDSEEKSEENEKNEEKMDESESNESEDEESEMDEDKKENEEKEDEKKENNSESQIKMDEMKDKMKYLEKEARKNIKEEQKIQKKYFDIRLAPTAVFNVGDMVLVQNSRKRTRQGSGMEPNFTGPYKITKIKRQTSAKVEPVDSRNKPIRGTVSFARLKHYGKIIEKKVKKENEEEEKIQNSCEKENEDECGLKKKMKMSDEVEFVQESHGQDQVKYILPEKKWMESSCNFFKITDCPNDSKFSKAPNGQFNRHKGPKKQNIHKIIGDGNCLFRALSFAVTGNQKSFKKIRAAIVQLMEKNEDPNLVELMDNCSSVEEYLNKSKMKEDKTWGTDIEILIFARMLNCVVYLWNEKSWLTISHKPMEAIDETMTTIFLVGGSGHFDIVLDPSA